MEYLGYLPTDDQRRPLDYHLTQTADTVILRAAERKEIRTVTALAEYLQVPRSRLYRTIRALDLMTEVRNLLRAMHTAS